LNKQARENLSTLANMIIGATIAYSVLRIIQTEPIGKPSPAPQPVKK
jgi:hypothetical protein